MIVKTKKYLVKDDLNIVWCECRTKAGALLLAKFYSSKIGTNFKVVTNYNIIIITGDKEHNNRTKLLPLNKKTKI